MQWSEKESEQNHRHYG